MSTATSAASSAPWHAAFPAPRNADPEKISREDVLDYLRDRESYTAGKGYVLVDLRRNDHEGGAIHGSINLPAQSLYPSIPTLYTLFKAAGVLEVIWFCSSSRGRGPRAAGWFSDYIEDQNDDKMLSLVLSEGIKGWALAGDEFVEWMDNYDANAWRKE